MILKMVISLFILKTGVFCWFTIKLKHFFVLDPAVQWIRRLTTDQEIPGSNPGGVNPF